MCETASHRLATFLQCSFKALINYGTYLTVYINQISSFGSRFETIQVYRVRGF